MDSEVIEQGEKEGGGKLIKIRLPMPQPAFSDPKKPKDSENWVEITSIKQVKVFNLGTCFLLNSYTGESKKLLDAIYTNIFYSFLFSLLLSTE